MAKSEIPKIETEYLMAINPTFKLEEVGRTPYGRRRIVHSATGDFKGQGKLKGLKGTIEAAFGWTLIRDHDRVWEINVRMVLRPADDSSKENLIYASWMGLRHGYGNRAAERMMETNRPLKSKQFYFRITPYFETSSEGKYAWLNKIYAVGTGSLGDATARTLHIFRVL
jgi:hypothetical protein